MFGDQLREQLLYELDDFFDLIGLDPHEVSLTHFSERHFDCQHLAPRLVDVLGQEALAAFEALSHETDHFAIGPASRALIFVDHHLIEAVGDEFALLDDVFVAPAGLEPLWAKPRSVVSCLSKILIIDLQTIVIQLPTTGASRWSSLGHPRRNDFGESHHMLIASSPQQHPPLVLDRLLDPVGRCLTRRSAQALLNLQADADLQAHIEDSARKSTAGKLTAEERSEYEALVAAGAVDFHSEIEGPRPAGEVTHPKELV